MTALYLIPFQEKYLIYRPLLGLLFLGNRAMADCAREWCKTGMVSSPEAAEYLRRMGFTRPDPPEPTAPDISLWQPTSAALLMTNRCNLRCVYCYADGGAADSRDLSPELGRRAIRMAAENAARQGRDHFNVTFHGGGEPTLCRETLLELAAYVRTQSLPAEAWMVTNGCWDEKYGKQLMDALDGMTISVDGAAETQNAQRPTAGGGASFPRVLRTLEQLSRAEYPFNIRMTALPERFEALPEDVRFLCENTGCRTIQAEPAFYQTRGAHGAMPKDQGRRFVEAFFESYDIAASYGVEFYYSGARPQAISACFCEAPLGESLTLNPAGEITGCYEMTGRGPCEAVFGRMDESGAHIDEEKRLRFMRGVLRRKDRCRECFCYYHCAGDCFTRGMPCEGESGPYNRCGVNRAITLELLLRALAEGQRRAEEHTEE